MFDWEKDQLVCQPMVHVSHKNEVWKLPLGNLKSQIKRKHVNYTKLIQLKGVLYSLLKHLDKSVNPSGRVFEGPS